jgi:hypothetical protein
MRSTAPGKSKPSDIEMTCTLLYAHWILRRSCSNCRPLIAQDLADQRAIYRAQCRCLAVNIPAEDRPGAMRAMSLPVSIARAGEILLDNVDAGEGGVLPVDSGVELPRSRPRLSSSIGLPRPRRCPMHRPPPQARHRSAGE